MANRLGILLLWGIAILLAVPAYWLLFTTFMPYDDEGYVLISLKNYSTHGGLYSQVFSQYGPFFYLFHDLGHRVLGYEFTNTMGRFSTLGCWLLAAGASAHLVWRQTRSLAPTGFTLGLTFLYLKHMVREPVHPGGLIAVLVALGAWWGTELAGKKATTALAITTGLLGGALLLTKINVGGFYLAAAGAWFAVQLRTPAAARIAAWSTAVLLTVLPGLLMHAHWGETSCRLFILSSMVAILTMLMIAWQERQPLTTWRDAGWGSGTLLLVGGIIVGLVCLRGTTLPAMAEGVLWGPLRHPSVYHFLPDWQPGTVGVGGASLILGGLVWLGRMPELRWLLLGLRLVLVLGFSSGCITRDLSTIQDFVMSYGVPLAWIFVLRLDPADAPEDRLRAAPWVGLLLVLQYLHAYPVAGTQVAWGTFLFVPLMGLGLDEAQRLIARQRGAVLPGIIGLVCLALTVGAVARLAATGWELYKSNRPLALPGAGELRPSADEARTLRLLALNATAHGDMLYSLPGMFSFNGWTELPTPTLNNTTHWFSLLNPQQQEEIATALTRSNRPVLIVNQGLLDLLAEKECAVTGSLNHYLQQNFERAFRLRNYEFWVRRGRVVVPLGTAELLRLTAPQTGMTSTQLELVVAIPPGEKIARIELVSLEEASRIMVGWNQRNCRLLFTGINLQGEAMTPLSDSGWDQPLPRLVRLRLPVEKAFVFGRSSCAFYLRDSNGALLAEARFLD